MKKLLPYIIFLVAGSNAFAQTQKFDIASFVPPPGWQRLDSNGKVGFLDAKSTNGGTHFCQILLYPSRVGTGNATRDFNDEWNNTIVKATGYRKKPDMQSKNLPDGWTVITGYANIPSMGNTYTCTLTSYSGYGKVMSVLVNLAGSEYLPVINSFFKNFALSNVNTSTSGPANLQVNAAIRPGELSDYVFTPPAGWAITQYPDGIVVSSPVSNTGEKCNITCWPMRGSSGNLQADANKLFAQVFSAFDLKFGSTPAAMVRGVSSQGWEYFIVKRGIVLRGGDFQTSYGFAMVAKLGNQVAAISGISKDPLVSSCFGLMLTDVWPKFFYSLQFKNWQGTSEQTAINNRLAGVWMAVTASAGDRMAFTANGRFAGSSALQRYVVLSSTELLRITDAYFGDGSYNINGYTMQLKHDNEQGSPEKAFFRLEQISGDEGITWKNKLFLLRRGVTDGNEYEVAYDKQ